MQKPTTYTDISLLIPHHSSMALIHHIIERGDNYLIASVDLSKPSLFTEADGRIPSYVGLEYMAQTISALIGSKALDNNHPIKLGFLLGTRKFTSTLSYFPKDETLIIRAEAIMIDEQFGVFDCSITTADNRKLCHAQLKAVQPDDISAIQ